jgi:hypothetical protein
MTLRGFRRSYVAIVICAAATLPSVGVCEISLTASTDFRGSLVLLEEIYRPNETTPPNIGGSNSGYVASVSKTYQDVRALPSLSVNFRSILYEYDKLGVGLHQAFNYVDLRATYPNGFSISYSDISLKFTESASFNLRSFELSFGPYLQWKAIERLHLTASLLLIHQRLKLSSELGSWELEDRLDRTYLGWNASIDYSFVTNYSTGRLHPSVFLNVAGRPNETNLSVGLRISFQ